MKKVFFFLLIACSFTLASAQEDVATLYPKVKAMYADGQKATVEGRYADAIAIFLEAGEICQKINHPLDYSRVLNEIGGCYMLSGQFDKGLESFNKSIAIKKKAGLVEELLPTYNNLGNLFYSYGNNEKALEFLQLGLEIIDQVSDQDMKGQLLFNLGYFYYNTKQYDKALEYVNKSLPLLTAAANTSYLSSANYIKAEMCYKLKDYDQANLFLDQAMAAQRKLKRYQDLSISFNLSAMIALEKKDIMKATVCYQLAADILPQGSESKGTAVSLFNLGYLYLKQKDYAKAEESIKKSIVVIEKMRAKATGTIRRDFMQQMVNSYQYLTAIYLRMDQPAKAFNTIETMSGKYLIDQLNQKKQGQPVEFTEIEKYQLGMNDKTVVLSFSNVALSTDPEDFIGIAAMCASRSGLLGKELDFRNFVNNNMAASGTVMASNSEKMRGFKPVIQEENAIVACQQTATDFESLISLYRQLLAKQILSGQEQKTLDAIGKGLYDLLIAPFENQLAGKTELVIIPGDVLAFIPFEALKSKDGKYLVEKFTIKYTQSLSVSRILASRVYPANRKDLLAIGGAVYETGGSAGVERGIKNISSNDEYSNLRIQTLDAIDNRPMKLGGLYPKFGIPPWENLTGTLEELKNIKTVILAADLITGTDANETNLKNLSAKGELKKYKVIHFATHGLALPELPELSTLVLSLSDTAQSPDDGYLRMSEISALDLQCDFVNLSACETGLGKLYGGEGVVGLTQSFLIAGANNLSVSLWQVADLSTMEFMTGVYSLVRDKKMSYTQAMREMKLQFIKGKYNSPFYWAPFVMYGI